MLNLIDALEFRARSQPNVIALQDVDSSLNYAQLYLLVKKIAKKISSIGVKPGQLAFTYLPPKVDWIFTLALFHETCITCSHDGISPVDETLEVDWLISIKPIPTFPPDRTILIDDDWLAQAQTQTTENNYLSYESQDSVCRLIMTSGTTGHAKAAPYTMGVLLRRLDSLHGSWPSGQDEICMMSLQTTGGLVSAAGAVRYGRTYYCASNAKDFTQLLIKSRSGSLYGSPMQLASLANYCKSNEVKLPCLKQIRTAGGMISEALLASLKSQFDVVIFNLYGSTEAGAICVNSIKRKNNIERLAGFVVLDAKVELVDDSNEPLEIGQEGIVRVKTSSMVSEYYKNSKASHHSFRGGWFYPGDRGVLTEKGALILSGRESELINRGGVKFDPAVIDEYLLCYPGIRDAAAFARDTESGIPDVAAAIVTVDGFDLNALKQKLIEQFGNIKSPSVFFSVKEIPRNQMGKVNRKMLNERASAAVT